MEASGSHRGSPGRPVRAPGSFQSATSAPERGRSKSVSMLFKRGVLVPFDPPVNPTGFQAHWELIFPMLDPSAGCLIGSLNPSFIREDPQACDISLLFQLTCQGRIPTRSFLLHSYQAPRCPSSVSLVEGKHFCGLLAIFSESCSICSCSFDVLILCVGGEEGGNLRIFLLYRLHLTLRTEYFIKSCGKTFESGSEV